MRVDVYPPSTCLATRESSHESLVRPRRRVRRDGLMIAPGPLAASALQAAPIAPCCRRWLTTSGHATRVGTSRTRWAPSEIELYRHRCTRRGEPRHGVRTWPASGKLRCRTRVSRPARLARSTNHHAHRLPGHPCDRHRRDDKHWTRCAFDLNSRLSDRGRVLETSVVTRQHAQAATVDDGPTPVG